MNLDNEELKATKEKQEKYTITLPLITNQELEEIDKHYNDYIEELVKAVTHDKDLIVLQEVIKEQKRRIEKAIQMLKSPYGFFMTDIINVLEKGDKR